MPNTFISPDVLARMALAILYERTMATSMVFTDLSATFGEVGDTINVRIPPTLTSNTYNRVTRTISTQDVTETKTPVTIDTLETVDVEILSEDWALEPVQFARRVIAPAVEAIAQKIDADIFTQLQATSIVAAAAPLAAGGGLVGVAAGAASDPRTLADVGLIMNNNLARRQGRQCVLSNAAEANFVKSDYLVRTDHSDSTAALREATVGRLFGFETFHSSNLPDAESLCFSRDAFAFVQRALPVPPGANGGSAVSRDGMSIRVIHDYDMGRKSTVASFDVLYGTAALRPEHVVALGS